MPRLLVLARLALLALLAAPILARADDVSEIRDLLARGDGQAALLRAEKALAANPRDAQSRFLLGVALMDLRRDEDALTHFTRMTQDYPDLPDPLNNVALLHARAGRPEMARLALEAALRADPTHRLARTNLGHVHLMLAVQAWDRAAALGPLDPAVQRRLEAARQLLEGRAVPASGAAR
ncbi:MAG: tetratricopeptide repeat protein [Rubrivivax sp.]|nr:tetratricopeptide repeat protein [Rubrivivax sp.]